MITEENEPELSRKKSQKKVTIEETATKKSKKKREEQRPKFYLNESRTLLTAVNEKRERMEMQTNGASMSSLRSSSAPGLSSKKSIEVVVGESLFQRYSYISLKLKRRQDGLTI